MSSSKDYKSDKSLAFKIIAAVLACVLLISVILIVAEIFDDNQGEFASSADSLDKHMTYNGADYVLNEDIETFLVLGLDKFESDSLESYNNDKQADFLMLFVLDNKAKTYKVVHLNRDSMVEMNVLGVAGDKIDTITQQLALSHTYGNGKEVSCRNTANAVSVMLLGADIDHYASLTMDAVSSYNDLLGGITVEILDDFSGIDDTLVKGETISLDGKRALTYVRSRYGLDDPTNNSRMNRQKQYLEAVRAKTHEKILNDSSFVSNVGIEMSKYIVSDCSVNKLEVYMNKISEYEFISYSSVDGETVMGAVFVEFYPDENAILDIVVDCFYKKTA